MENWRTSWNKIVARFWIPAIAILVALVVWELFRVAPLWLEKSISRALSDRGMVVTSFPVERIGASRLEILPGSILYEQHSFEWDSIVVEYGLDRLLQREVERVVVLSPQIGLNFDIASGDTMSADRLIEQEVPSSGAADIPADPVKPVVAQDEALHGTTLIPDAASDAIDIRNLLHELPLRSFSAQNGVVNIQLQSEKIFSSGFEAELARQPFGVSGDLFLESDEGSIHLSLRAPSAKHEITVQGGAAMPAYAVRSAGNYLMDQVEYCNGFPRITSSGPLQMDFYAEQNVNLDVTGSAELQIDELSLLIPGGNLEVTLDELVAAGYYQDAIVNIEGGGDLLLPMSKNLQVEPFGFRYSLRNSNDLGIETEIFNWNYNGIRGRCALLGGGDLSRIFTQGWARIEASFAELIYGSIYMDPFSILASHDVERISLRASPLGVYQSGTLWIEELAGFVNMDLSAGKGEFQWYGLLGEALGSVAFDYSRKASSRQYEVVLTTPDEGSALQSDVTETDGDYQLDAAGKVHLAWLNTLMKWFGYASLRLGGEAPQFDAQLNYTDSLLSGYFQLQLPGLDVTTDSGMQLRGIKGGIDGAVMILPRTLGRQVTSVANATSGPIELHDIRIEWELKSLRELVIHHFSGKIGDGIIELEPFTINPIRPVFDTAVIIRKFDADLLRQWLSEKRFSIDAFISGRIPLGWEKGQLILGSGEFAMDTESDKGWLKFEDERFLQDKFAAVGGVPADLKDRLLDALWENGIQMDGMEIYLGATNNEGELSFKISVNGETASELIEFPIGGFVLNNLISLEDLATLMNMVAPVRIDPNLGRD